jgi:coatomer subunit beta
MAERPCTLLIHQHSSEPLRIQQVKQIFESGTDEEKIAALQKTITLIIAGEPLPQLLMHIIRFVMPSKNHTIKKLLLIYWEVVNKKSADGKLLQEMILVWCVYFHSLYLSSPLSCICCVVLYFVIIDQEE